MILKLLVKPLVSASALRARTVQLADTIAQESGGRPLHIFCVLKGARRFTDDLQRLLAARGMALTRGNLRVRRSQGTRLGPLHVEDFDFRRLSGRDVLLVDDVADEGLTLWELCERIRAGGARSLRVCVLFDKSQPRPFPLSLDYVGFRESSENWLVGYGMDVNDVYRDLDWVGVWRYPGSRRLSALLAVWSRLRNRFARR